ncbi:hypothetical protein C9994_07155 [Marivirga lumbricoides]|uniref:Uncharacterized protein n=1 Tax=Marivirga lumbricoides TaxID=1046115 RepID=A0A2T4DRQ9_9BACT|nr:hypothetical protein C9994_07155 [Marivirga lumbricoides]
MEKYKSLHLWMIIPMVVMQLGIFMDYWGDFSDNAWSVHIHYWTGTIWYIYLIIQPYYATHGQMEKHRTNGIIGMFLAGGVCLTALSMMHRDNMVSDLALAEPERFGPFKPWLFFGIASIEIIMMTAFGFAIIMSIVKRKSLEDHAWWLISTVFLIMMPAVGRGIQNLFIITKIKHWPDIDIITPIYISQALIILLLLLTAWKYKKLKHPATYLAVVVNVICCFVVPIGKSEAIQTLLRSMIKG